MDRFSDVELVEKYRSGERFAFDELYLRYEKMISAIADMFVFSGVEKVDLVQEGAAGLFKAVIGYDRSRENASSFSTFAYLCVKTQIIGVVKSRGRDKTALLQEIAVADDGSIPSPEEDLIKSEVFFERKRSLMDELSVFENKVFELYLKGYSYVEIAGILGETPKSVDNALVRIKNKAKKVATL